MTPNIFQKVVEQLINKVYFNRRMNYESALIHLIFVIWFYSENCVMG